MSDSKVKARAELLHKRDKGYRSSSNWHFLLYLLGLVAAVLAIRAFVFEPIRVDGESMRETLQDNEYCFAEKVSYLFSGPKQGDIVIVYYSDYDLAHNRNRRTYVKRVIATEGQTVEVRRVFDKGEGGEYYVFVDGEMLDETAYNENFLIAANENYSIIGYDNGICTVPEGCVFVMGDHRTNSHDSRAADVGPIPLHDVIGKVRLVVNFKEKSLRIAG